MVVVRYADEFVTRKYVLEIDDDVIRDLNDALDIRTNGQPHPIVTKGMVYAVLSRDGNPEQYPELENDVPCGAWGPDTLHDFIYEEVNELIWEADSDIVDGETENWEDEVSLEPEEKAELENGVQMTIYDIPTENESEGE